MKYSIVLALFTVAVVAASPAHVDLSKLKPLHKAPPVFPDVSLEETLAIGGRITNGQVAEKQQFKYQVGLSLHVQGGQAWCGGTLIAPRWVVTAAHCTDGLSTGVDVYMGAWDRLNRTEEGQQVIFVAKKYVILHEQWDPEALFNDISLIKLPVPIEFNDYIQPAKLPKKGTYASYENEMAIASGWGRISDEATGATDKLRFIEVPILNQATCNRWFFGSIKESNICIKTTGGTSTCNGDSGGPLVLANDTQTLIGATSFGIGLGCQKGWPGVFTRITSYLDWIEKHTGVVNV